MEEKTTREPIENHNDESNDSVIIYMSWVICLWEFGLESFAKAMYALFNYACYNKAISSFKLPRKIEAIVNTFTPIIDSNRKKRQNGKKGASYGKLGGRPKNPSGVIAQTPNGMNTLNANDKETVSVTETGGSDGSSENSSDQPHTDSFFFLFVFFFRNLRNPRRQAEKFVTHYTATGWRLSGGDYVATDEARIALAKKWEVKDDTTGRFKDEDLAMWKSIYDIAPNEIKKQMLCDEIEIQKIEEKAYIKCPDEVQEWMEDNKSLTLEILRKWVHPCKGITYLPIEKR